MSVTIKFETDNDAFYPDRKIETCAILNLIIDNIERGILSSVIRDANGNTIGRYEVD